MSPLYTFECRECEKQTEVILLMNAEKPKVCDCGGMLDQIYHPFAVFIGKAPQSFHRKFAAPHYDGKKP